MEYIGIRGVVAIRVTYKCVGLAILTVRAQHGVLLPLIWEPIPFDLTEDWRIHRKELIVFYLIPLGSVLICEYRAFQDT